MGYWVERESALHFRGRVSELVSRPPVRILMHREGEQSYRRLDNKEVNIFEKVEIHVRLG